MRSRTLVFLAVMMLPSCITTACYGQGTVGAAVGLSNGIQSEFTDDTDAASTEVDLVYSGWLLIGSRDKEVRSYRWGAMFNTQQVKQLYASGEGSWRKWRMTTVQVIHERILLGGAMGTLATEFGAGFFWLTNNSAVGAGDAWSTPSIGVSASLGLRGSLHVVGPVSLTAAITGTAFPSQPGDPYPFESGMTALVGLDLYIDNPPDDIAP